MVGEVIRQYLGHLRQRRRVDDLSQSHLVASERDLARFAAFVPEDADAMGQQRIDRCRNADLMAFISRPGWSNATRRRVLSEVLACFRWAADDGDLIERNPFRRPKTLRMPVRPRRSARTAEYILLMRAGNRALRRALFFLRRTPSRTCELREAVWPDVDWSERVIVLHQNKTSRITGEPRIIGLEPCAYRFLRNLHRQARDKAGPVFLNTRGRQWTANGVCQAVRKTLQRLGADPGRGKRVTAYMLRHLWTGTADERGLSNRQIADALGHADTKLVDWYAKGRQKAAHLVAVATKAMQRDRD